MYKKDVLKFYGTPDDVCKALNITQVAFCNWSEIVPQLRAYQIQVKTKGKLKIDESLYEKRTHAKRKSYYTPVSERKGTLQQD